jgi:hypothetical protein
MQNGEWGPTTIVFAEVAVNSVDCATFQDVVAKINAQRPKSIHRINIFTHGNSDDIVFKGVVTYRKGMSPEVAWTNFNRATGNPGLLSLDLIALNYLRSPGRTIRLLTNPQPFTLADLRNRFEKDAVIYIYACHSGSAPSFLKEVYDTFQVVTIGFTEAIAYCPAYNIGPPITIDRKHIGIKSCKTF